jgi:hypothetical protein
MDAAFTRLRNELIQLRGKLKDLRSVAQDDSPDSTHCVPSRIIDSVTDMNGWLRKSLGATRLALTAMQGEAGGGGVPKMALSRLDEHWRKLTREFRRQVGGATRMKELRELAASRHLPRRNRPPWSTWVGEVKKAIQKVRRQIALVSQVVASCWRELASRPAPAGIVITNVAVGR